MYSLHNFDILLSQNSHWVAEYTNNLRAFVALHEVNLL